MAIAYQMFQIQPENGRVLPLEHLLRIFSSRAAEAGVSSSATPPAASSHPWAAHSQRNSCASTMQHAVWQEGLGWGGLLKTLKKYMWWCCTVLKFLRWFQNLLHSFSQHNYSATFAHLCVGTTSGEQEAKLPHGLLCLSCISPCWGLISVPVHWQNFNHWMKLHTKVSGRQTSYGH